MSGGAWALLGKVLGSLAALAINVLLARLMTMADMGLFFIATSIVHFISVIALLGLQKTVIRLAAEALAKEDLLLLKGVIKRVMVICLMSALLVAAIIQLVGADIIRYTFKADSIAEYIGWLSIWAVFLTLGTIVAESFRGMHNIRDAALYSGFFTSAFMVLMLYSVWIFSASLQLYEALQFIAFSTFLSAMIGSTFLYRKLRNIKGSKTVSNKSVLMISAPLFVSSVTLFGITQADLWVMGIFASKEETALYGGAMRLLILIWLPLFLINSVVPPIISEHFALDKKEALEKILRVVATLSGVPGAIALLVFFFAADAIMALVYGTGYSQGGIILLILAAGHFVNTLAGSCGLVLMLSGHQNTHMMITVFAGVISVAGAILLVGPFGGVGVAASAAGSMSLYNIAMVYAVKRKTGIWTHAGIPDLKLIRQLM